MARQLLLSAICSCGLVLACFVAPSAPRPAASIAATPKAETETKAKAVIEVEGGVANVPIGDLIVLDGTKSEATSWKWLVIPKKTFLPTDGGKRVAFAAGTPGTYQFVLSVANGGSVDSAIFAVTVGQPTPPQPLPPPPGPSPNPTPPTPNPPSPQPGLRVLIVEESSQRSSLPRPQLAAMFSPQAASYLNAKCAAGPSGTPDWRRWDDDIDATNAGPLFREMLAAPRQSLPWIVIRGDAGIVHSGPFPATEADLLALLRRYGG